MFIGFHNTSRLRISVDSGAGILTKAILGIQERHRRVNTLVPLRSFHVFFVPTVCRQLHFESFETVCRENL
jgi:hypothetical protein